MDKIRIPRIPKIVIPIFFDMGNFKSFDDHKKAENAIGSSVIKDLENGFRNEVSSRNIDTYPTKIP